MDYKLYDFSQSENVSKDALRTISFLHENCARILGAGFSSYLRTITEVVLEGIDQVTYAEFIQQIPNPAAISVLSIKPLEGNAVLEISLNFTFFTVDRLLGGNGISGVLDRGPTEIEQTISAKISQRVIDALKEAWAHAVRIEPEIVATETNPQIVQIVAASERVLLVRFKITIGELSGYIKFAVPIVTLKPIMEKLGAQQWFSGAQKSDKSGPADRDYIRKNIDKVNVPVAIQFSRADITLRDLLKITTGDVLRLKYDPSKKQSEVYIAGRLKFYAKAGLIDNKKAVKITQVL